MKNYLLIGIGIVSLLLGTVGLVLPILPTTPFVLLSVSCFSCTPSLQSKILRIGFVKEYYEGYKENKGISKKTFCCSLLYMWSMLILSMFMVGKIWLIVLLVSIGTAVSIYISSLYRLGKGKR